MPCPSCKPACSGLSAGLDEATGAAREALVQALQQRQQAAGLGRGRGRMELRRNALQLVEVGELGRERACATAALWLAARRAGRPPGPSACRPARRCPRAYPCSGPPHGHSRPRAPHAASCHALASSALAGSRGRRTGLRLAGSAICPKGSSSALAGTRSWAQGRRRHGQRAAEPGDAPVHSCACTPAQTLPQPYHPLTSAPANSASASSSATRRPQPSASARVRPATSRYAAFSASKCACEAPTCAPRTLVWAGPAQGRRRACSMPAMLGARSQAQTTSAGRA